MSLKKSKKAAEERYNLYGNGAQTDFTIFEIDLQIKTENLNDITY